MLKIEKVKITALYLSMPAISAILGLYLRSFLDSNILLFGIISIVVILPSPMYFMPVFSYFVHKYTEKYGIAVVVNSIILILLGLIASISFLAFIFLDINIVNILMHADGIALIMFINGSNLIYNLYVIVCGYIDKNKKMHRNMFIVHSIFILSVSFLPFVFDVNAVSPDLKTMYIYYAVVALYFLVSVSCAESIGNICEKIRTKFIAYIIILLVSFANAIFLPLGRFDVGYLAVLLPLYTVCVIISFIILLRSRKKLSSFACD